MSVSPDIAVPDLAVRPHSLPDPSTDPDRPRPPRRSDVGSELDDLPDLETSKAVIDRWVEELSAAGALDEATTDVFERLIDDWAARLRQRLLQDRLDREVQDGVLQAEAKAAAARALLDAARAEREHDFALASLTAARRRSPEGAAAATALPDRPAQGPEAAAGPPAPDLAARPDQSST